ncbi:unnamed protein product [Prorocentrum cordatum]|uniref:Prohibitin n=1 Tax=Prorocentrum cordatum TaxID=2364126 RepID=A0ABN9Y3H5_9DINO|nr:unnamed protein product [Polarella glacialis]
MPGLTGLCGRLKAEQARRDADALAPSGRAGAGGGGSSGGLAEGGGPAPAEVTAPPGGAGGLSAKVSALGRSGEASAPELCGGLQRGLLGLHRGPSELSSRRAAQRGLPAAGLPRLPAARLWPPAAGPPAPGGAQRWLARGLRLDSQDRVCGGAGASTVDGSHGRGWCDLFSFASLWGAAAMRLGTRESPPQPAGLLRGVLPPGTNPVAVGGIGLAVLAGLAVCYSVGNVEITEHALNYSMLTRKAERRAYTAGRYWIGPFNYFIKFPAILTTIQFSDAKMQADLAQSGEAELRSRTQDGLDVFIELSFQYQLQSVNLYDLYTNLDGQLSACLVTTMASQDIRHRFFFRKWLPRGLNPFPGARVPP